MGLERKRLNYIILSLYTISHVSQNVQAYTICGNNICEGATAYCCNWNQEECCWGSWLGLWWLWCITGIFILLIGACIVCCCRQQMRHQYLVIHQPGQPPLYGATSSYAVYGGSLVSQGQNQVTKAPV